jgi:hypothetical protein
MALDSSLFTLTLQRRPNDAAIVDLIPFNPSSIASTSTCPPSPLYSFSRARSADYNVQLTDHLTSIPLASIISPTSAAKIRKIDLHNPEESVIFERKEKLFRQDWRWTWQDQEYLIRRDGHMYIVEAVRLPDPEIDIARYTPATKSRSAFLQILDYNIQRLEIADRRGLEVLILMAVCTLLDLDYDEKHKDGAMENIYSSGSPSVPSLANSRTSSHTTPASSQAPNEILIDLHTGNEVYVQHAIRLMRQDEGGEGLHLIILKATSPQSTPKVVQIAAEIKLRWYRLEPIAKGRTLDPLPGSTSEIAEELYQYVRDPSLQKLTSQTKAKEESGQRRRIKLDAPDSTSSLPATQSPSGKNQKAFLAPPEQLDIYLSKERIDEFEVSNQSSHTRHAANGPSKSTAILAPSIPPKRNKQSRPVSSDGSNSGHGIRTVFGKLGLRKTPANEG